MNSHTRHRRATGLMRAILVGSSTLAILLVCFAIYQYSQPPTEPAHRLRQPRLPSPPTHTTGFDGGVARAAEGVKFGTATVGPARDIKLTIYPREGTRARLEIAVQSWTPVAGVANEFRLIQPEIRLRTKDGRGIRVTARSGTLEARSRSEGRLDPQRGQLTGDVVIEIERLPEEERTSQAAFAQAKPNPGPLIRVELNQIEFDLEYSKIVVPHGGLHLMADDVDFRASDLELRFNEQAGRIETIRVNEGGSLVLLGSGDGLGLSLPGAGSKPISEMSLAQWLRTAIEAGLAARQVPQPTGQVPDTARTADLGQNGVPVFHPDSAREDDAGKPPLTYLARFEDRVDVQQLDGTVIQSRLRADRLELLRDVSQADRDRARAPAGQRAGAEGSADTPRDPSRITLTWQGRLTVRACAPGEPNCGDDERLAVTATGSPVLVTVAGGEASCGQLAFDPESSDIVLDSNGAEPVVIRSGDMGVLTGVRVSTEHDGDEFHVHVSGPGSLSRPAGTQESSATVSPTVGTSASLITFDKQLDVDGRIVRRTSLGLTGRITTTEHRVLDRATFLGRVRLREDDLSLDADEVELTFEDNGRTDGRSPSPTHVKGRGHVVLRQGDDRITCGEIDIVLVRAADGRTVPQVATARFDVTVVQGDRIIRARDALTVDFETIWIPPGSTLSDQDSATALQPVVEGELPTRPERSGRTNIVLRRLRAHGEVEVVDPNRALELTAEHLDCQLDHDQQIETASLVGEDDRPAFVRLGNFTVMGGRIELNVPEQWAEVPGAGRLSFRSRRDLDGRRADEPIPIAITWTDWMRYHGQDNEARFGGNVHATSRATTTFDCDELLIEFEDAPVVKTEPSPAVGWSMITDLVDRAMGGRREEESPWGRAGFSKEPAHILATGKAIAETIEIDPVTGAMVSRAKLTGPRLSVDLRPQVSRMLIEGAGSLLIEDFRPAKVTARSNPTISSARPMLASPHGAVAQRPAAVRSSRKHRASTQRQSSGLLSIGENAGPSKTLIEWQEVMWYDFSVNQTRFEGDVELKHFSGAQLERLFGRASGGSAELPTGRSTFLACDVLSVDFLDRKQRRRKKDSRRMGGLSADRLRRFQAAGSVKLQDQTEGLALTAERVIYERGRNLLAVHGSSRAKAHIVIRKPGQRPRSVTTDRFFYDLATGRIEAFGTTMTGR